MKRRVFIAGLGGAAAWPLVAGAQPIERMRRIAVLVDAPQDDRSRPRVAAFIQGLMDLGWSEGRNAQIHIRWEQTIPKGAAA
jgi:putative ABC transport system substrate-binding protein